VSNWLVCDGKLAEVVTSHFWTDFDLVEGLAVVDAHNRANHFWDDDHVTEMCLDCWRLFALVESLLGLSESLEKSERLASDAPNELSSCPAVHQVDKLVCGQLEELVKVNTPVGVLLECTTLLRCGHG